MSTQVRFVRNNPFILNDSRFGSGGDLAVKEQISTNYGYSGHKQVSQSASCSNLQQRSYFGSQFESQAPVQPPVPVPIFRRYRVISERNTDDSPLANQLSKQSELSNSIHSVAYYDQKSEQGYEVSMNYNKQVNNQHRSEENQWDKSTQVAAAYQSTFERRLEHSQSHGAISQVHLREPLRIELTDKEDSQRREGRQDPLKQKENEPLGENYMEYGPGIVQKLREKFSKMASTAIETAQISPHAKQKKFPSVDDILSEGERRNTTLERRFELHDSNHNHQTKYMSMQRKYSEDIDSEYSDSVDVNVTSQPTLFKQEKAISQSYHQEQHQQSPVHSQFSRQQEHEEPRSLVEASPIPPISALRAKFEKQSLQGSSSNFYSRPSYSQRSHSVQSVIRKSASRDDVIEDRRPVQKPLPPKIPEHKPARALPEPIPVERERELIKMNSYQDRSHFEREMEKAPKPVRIMDLVSPPADPGPKEFIQHHQLRSPEILPSPTASTASSDRSPPPEEPRLLSEDQELEIHYEQKQEYESRNNFRTQTLRDERSNERNVFNAQKQKITLTLPIGESHPQKSSSTSEIRIGKPGSTPITGPSKLKIANDDSGISEVQFLLSRFSVMREQKMQDSLQTDAIKETLTQLEEVQKEEKQVPTAIVPPVQQPPKPPVVPKPQSNWQPLQPQKNIVNISIGQEDNDEPSGSISKHRPAPPPPLPPKGGFDQQRKSLTSRWLENKESSTSSSSSFDTDDGTLDKKANDQEKDQKPTILFGLSKPYGEEMVDEHTRRSLETMSVVKEESEEDIEAEASVKLVGHRLIGEDSGFVHRSDFLKSSSFDNSSESDEDDSNDHLASYEINRFNIYDPPALSDNNPVRHSLLHLVAEEDIPELLQAMAEEHHFVFDDCDDMPTTSGIIHTPAKRQERKKQRNVDRICFVEDPPKVFAYLDETSANEESEWTEGVPITFDEYKSIVEATQQEQAQQNMELAKWRMLMEQKYGQSNEESEVVERASESDLGMTSTFVYSEAIDGSSGKVLQFQQTDMGASAI